MIQLSRTACLMENDETPFGNTSNAPHVFSEIIPTHGQSKLVYTASKGTQRWVYLANMFKMLTKNAYE